MKLNILGVCLLNTIKTLVHTNGFSPKQLLACAHKHVFTKTTYRLCTELLHFFTISYEHQIMSFAHTTKKREYNVFCTHC